MENFINEIIAAQKLRDMPEDFLLEYKQKLTEEAQKRMGLVAVSKLSEAEIKEFDQITKETNNDPAKIVRYLSSKIDNFDQIMAIALNEFKNEILAK